MNRPAANSKTPQGAVTDPETFRSAGYSLLVAGIGGNIGTSLVPHIPRNRGLKRVTVIDPDRYESKNLRGQNIEPGDVGRLKAQAMACRMRRIDPTLPVEAIVGRVEDVPLGRLRADVIMTCLDSRAARCYVNQAVRRLGIPWWLDAGVERDGLLARVNVYRVPDSPCFECGWSDRDYENLEQIRPCLGGAATPAPTDSPSALGALAASLQALELQKIVTGDWESVAAAKQITVSAAFHKYFVTSLRVDPSCRCEHDAWTIRSLDCSPGQLPLGEALGLEAAGGRGGPPNLSVAGKSFVRQMECTGCGWRRSLTRLEGRLARAHRTCTKCRGRMEAVGYTQLERLNAGVLPRATLARPLARLGFQPGDIFTIERGGRAAHYEFGDTS